jgi:hypothetical protein
MRPFNRGTFGNIVMKRKPSGTILFRMAGCGVFKLIIFYFVCEVIVKSRGKNSHDKKTVFMLILLLALIINGFLRLNWVVFP